jgi:hypothetical protein
VHFFQFLTTVLGTTNHKKPKVQKKKSGLDSEHKSKPKAKGREGLENDESMVAPHQHPEHRTQGSDTQRSTRRHC